MNEKNKLIQQYQLHDKDTGSFSLQLELITKKISFLKIHLSKFKNDKHSRYGLLKLISKRKKIISYLNKKQK